MTELHHRGEYCSSPKRMSFAISTANASWSNHTKGWTLRHAPRQPQPATRKPNQSAPLLDLAFHHGVEEFHRTQSRPLSQFRSQVRREMDRLLYQQRHEFSGRRQTLPRQWGDLKANAENNVRKRWIAQGIWGAEWGQAWAPRDSPLSRTWMFGPIPRLDDDNSKKGPFYNINDERQGTVWGHESEQLQYPKPTVGNSESSRPAQQFKAQMFFERAWIQDELVYTRVSVSGEELDDMACQSVVTNWIEDGIWNPDWGYTPGLRWKHEESDEPAAQKEVSTGHPSIAGPVPEEEPAVPRSPPRISFPPRWYGHYKKRGRKRRRDCFEEDTTTCERSSKRARTDDGARSEIYARFQRGDESMADEKSAGSDFIPESPKSTPLTGPATTKQDPSGSSGVAAPGTQAVVKRALRRSKRIAARTGKKDIEPYLA